ncbi:PREDICTED: intraflagellar transport protein 27 homolog [Priapulus caudatus]|uniref:Intraflagellar transport protein 27 homolog n=1 Tax=Priapulus caudatus TaxID=37621 RepID=A0ABM1E7E9_PRICU|nr:PREDICTED: intraflagellar transport protein 27 homolog [Priapulus caudatus]
MAAKQLNARAKGQRKLYSGQRQRDATVGKTSLVQVLKNDQCPKTYTMTVGADLVVKSIHIPQTSDVVELYIHDCAGKEMFIDQIDEYIKQPSLVCLVYDVTNEVSLASCEKWLQKVRSQKPEISVLVTLIANKSDLTESRVVSQKEGQAFAEKNNMKYFECSAKDSKCVEAAFGTLANSFHHTYLEKTEFFKSLHA